MSAIFAALGTGKLLVNEPALDKLQALRDRLGKPLIVRSAYRSPEHNRAVGGATRSKHLDGAAFDIAMANHDPVAFEAAARAVGFLGFGFYPRSGFIHVATTRPETMLADMAVAVHPEDERYKGLVGQFVILPITGRRIPIVADDYADPTKGSGAVKITGAHDFNDYGVAQRNGIPLYALMDGQARMREDGLSYAESAAIAGAIARGEQEAGDVSQINLVPDDMRGLDRYAARKLVVEEINARALAALGR